MMKFTVAIDGPAAAGKGTISKRIAEHFDFAHLDTGLLYRATGRRALQGEDPVTAARSLTPQDLARSDLRTAEVAQAASRIAPLPEVRAALVEFQHTFAARDGGAVLDGRDIGTVICPEADVKLFVTASDQVRADRRYRELIENGETATPQQVLEDLRVRDARDRERAVAPLVAANDAVIIDTSDMTIDMAVAQAIAAVQQKLDK